VSVVSDGKASVFDYDAASFSITAVHNLKVQDGVRQQLCLLSCSYRPRKAGRYSLQADQVIERALCIFEQAGFQESCLPGLCNLTMYDHQGE
jgi:threonylcarbamoyladenosine tRNA methylthiotransferase MtaB